MVNVSEYPVSAKRAVQGWIVASGRTQGSLAAELGMSVGNLSQILNGRQRCSLELALRLSEMSGLPVRLFDDLRVQRERDAETAAA